jgi:hypothetical protein
MPPLRGGSGLRGRSRDIVSQVEDKLKLNTSLPREIVEATRSSLRVLKIRNPIGCFGKYDNDTKRACALLEYNVRDYNNSNGSTGNGNSNIIEVAMEQLAKAAFMKLQDFRDFHEKIGNFRENLRINATTRTSKTREQTRTRPNDANNESRRPAATAATRKTGIVFRKSSISSLAIQLGAFVPNSSDVALRAQRLFKEIVDLLNSSSRKRGMYGLRDVQKNQSSYEAACFYLIATATSERGNNKQDNNNASTRRRRRTSKEYDDGDDNQQLDLTTFMDIAKVSLQFQMILDYVSQLQAQIESKRSTIQNLASRSQPSFASSSGSSKSANPTASRKRSKKEAFGFAQAIANDSKKNKDANPDDQNADDVGGTDIVNTIIFQDDHDQKENSDNNNNKNHERPRKRTSTSRSNNATFEEWKSRVLRAACEDARQKMNASNKDRGGDDDQKDCETNETTTLLEQEVLLDFVTRDILARNGLL